MPLKRAVVVTADMRVEKGIERRFGFIVAGSLEAIGVSFKELGFGLLSTVKKTELIKKTWRQSGIQTAVIFVPF